MSIPRLMIPVIFSLNSDDELIFLPNGEDKPSITAK